MCKKTRASWKLLNFEDNISNYEKYLLETKDGRIIISQDNVLRVNAMIASNSSYRQSANPKSQPKLKKSTNNNTYQINDNQQISQGIYYEVLKNGDIKTAPSDDENFNYIGSSAFWFSKLKKFICNPGHMRTGVEVEYEQAGKQCSQTVSLGYVIYKTVCCVDNENSTHLNSDRMGRAWVASKLYDITVNGFNGKDIIYVLKCEDKDCDYKIINTLSENNTKYY